MGAVNTTYTFTATDTITSTKMNNIISQTKIDTGAIFGNTLEVVLPSGQLKVRTQGITSSEMAANSVKTISIEDGAVTASKLAAGAAIPAGAVMPFAMNSVPSGWLGADGTAVSRSTYAALFAAISTLYGAGDGSTTFNLPDLRGYFVRGAGTNVDGTVSGTFGAKQADELKSHQHSTNTGHIDGGSFGTTSGSNKRMAGFGSASSTTAHINTDLIGGTETRPKNIAMLYCIKI